MNPINPASDSGGSWDEAAISAKLKGPKVIGIYGIPGSGKTTLLAELSKVLYAERYSFYEGSEIIAQQIPGGLAAFQKLDDERKRDLRQLAIKKVYNDCVESRKTAIVTGHFMFWTENDSLGNVVCTESDMATYTHIVYLNVPPEIIEKRCSKDARRQRKLSSVNHLSKWQQAELDRLSPLCHKHGIFLSVVSIDQILQGKVQELIHDFDNYDEEYNDDHTMDELDEVVFHHLGQAETVMVIDGDRTITSQDTGKMFWEIVPAHGPHCKQGASPLKELFGGPLGYSYTAFRQATLLHEEVADDETYENVCQQVASATIIHSEFLSLLQLVKDLPRVGAIIVSCGHRRIWEIVLEKANLQETVAVMAGGRIVDKLVVTAATKAKIVTELQRKHHKRVWAFGDSPLDMKMLQAADHAVVVVTEEGTRSKSMEAALANAIENEALCALQVVLPSSAPPRLDTRRLPLVDITKLDFVNALLARTEQPTELAISTAAQTASKLLATPMRDAAVQGPSLRKAHQRTGWYLAHELVSRIIGLQPCPISHVLGRPTSGFQLANEHQTTIVSLMRGGDPMALGVNEAFPRASYVHVKVPEDLQSHHLDGQAQVILVDSVVNTGKSVIECIGAIRSHRPEIRIVIVAGVVQAQCLHRDSIMYKALSADRRVDIVALRVSETKFTGSGTTDTGNRLFNTTHLA
ncbi:hypothetical protein IAQ61_007831 [Plenodomus lingam]|uniref:Phosphoribosyltransferase domain-containing protein n=1 Tax=Leptosphaeria maculans (strain JN3 / isolate v23.1.3 / race Av1-4-5-6-7-8) TaxID=985895 RepID=E5A4J0_LEPMJ|nr:hypothetical protein LEMA_P077770.1 [Plenodomus lingam JN3]KAH9867239.1 hypothetical protein IAQ61_007831 [Plenodomus lingam]CBX98538.1 hypothetical protein LEMA_P077770.1 [Plenodomus lingam JN3]